MSEEGLVDIVKGRGVYISLYYSPKSIMYKTNAYD